MWFLAGWGKRAEARVQGQGRRGIARNAPSASALRRHPAPSDRACEKSHLREKHALPWFLMLDVVSHGLGRPQGAGEGAKARGRGSERAG